MSDTINIHIFIYLAIQHTMLLANIKIHLYTGNRIHMYNAMLFGETESDSLNYIIGTGFLFITIL